MKIRISTSFPIALYIDPELPAYFMVHMKPEGSGEEIEVSREVWNDLIKARHMDSIDTIARALDCSAQATIGEIPSIAESLASLAAHLCETSHEHYEVNTKPKDEEEPS